MGGVADLTDTTPLSYEDFCNLIVGTLGRNLKCDVKAVRAVIIVTPIDANAEMRTTIDFSAIDPTNMKAAIICRDIEKTVASQRLTAAIGTFDPAIAVATPILGSFAGEDETAREQHPDEEMSDANNR